MSFLLALVVAAQAQTIELDNGAVLTGEIESWARDGACRIGVSSGELAGVEVVVPCERILRFEQPRKVAVITPPDPEPVAVLVAPSSPGAPVAPPSVGAPVAPPSVGAPVAPPSAEASVAPPAAAPPVASNDIDVEVVPPHEDPNPAEIEVPVTPPEPTTADGAEDDDDDQDARSSSILPPLPSFPDPFRRR